MSSLNFTRKVFLEREELTRLQEFLRDDISFNTIVANTIQFGIIQTNFTGFDDNFFVEQGTATGSIQFAKAVSQALDIDGNLIRLLARDNIALTDDSNWYWVRISADQRRFEQGTVSINVNGEMTGLGTAFTDVLRGQATDVPVKVRFITATGGSANNNGTYEVVTVTDNTNALLTGPSTVFEVDTAVNMIVIGTLPIGEIVSTSQREGLYIYDSCAVDLIQETTLDTPPDLPVDGASRFFYVARVQRNGTMVTVQDQRDLDDTYWKFNVPGIQGAVLSRTVSAPAGADQYLFVGSLAQTSVAYARFMIQGFQAGVADPVNVYLGQVNAGLSFFAPVCKVDVLDQNNQGVAIFEVLFKLNAAGTRTELYLKSVAGTLGFTSGYITLVGTSSSTADELWEYADNFTWTGTDPTGLVAATVRYGYFGDTSLVENANSLITNRLQRANNLSDVTSAAVSRQNLSVYSQSEVDNLIDNTVGELVYSARIFATSAATGTTDLTVYLNKDSFIASVDAVSNRYRFNFTNNLSGWLDRYEVQATSGGTPTGTIGSNRNPVILDLNNGDGAEVYLADSSGNDAYGLFWIRFYQWLD